MSDNLPPLLPCPFCGNEKNIAMANEKHDHSGGYFIACPKCDASTGLRYAMGDDPRPLLVEQWNRRAAIAQAQSCVPAEVMDSRIADPFTYIIQHLNSDPYNLTKDECVELIKKLRFLYASPQPQPVQPSEQQYLCKAWGETDLPAAAIVSGLDGVRAFLVEQWLGDAEHEHDDGTKALPEAMADMQTYWATEGECWSAEFEIGGVSVQKVFHAAPKTVAQAKPEQAAQPEKDPLHDDIQSVLFEVEQAIENGVCPWQIEAAFEAYEAARRMQLPDHGIAAPQPKD